MVDFQPIQRSERVSDYKPELPQANLSQQEPSGDPKEFNLPNHKAEGETTEEEMREKIFESMMQMTLMQMQHHANQLLQKQKEAARQNG